MKSLKKKNLIQEKQLLLKMFLNKKKLSGREVERDDRRCAEVYSQRKLFQLTVTAIITIWPEAISQGWLSLSLSHERKFHLDAAYCLSPDLSL